MVTYLNRGMYDVVEAARLIRATPATVQRWGQTKRTRGALVEPSLDGLYSFHDLISLVVVAQLARERHLPLPVIANGIRTLEQDLQTPRPLAHVEVRDNLATVGRAFFARRGGEWRDIGKGGQGAFQDMLVTDLRRVEYGDDKLAAIWRPRDGVWLNPRVQAGAACLDNTRIPTATVVQIINSGDTVYDVAGDYDLDLDEVIAAVEFEKELVMAA